MISCLFRRLVLCIISDLLCFFFFKQKTAYYMRSSYWSSDVCSSDLREPFPRPGPGMARAAALLQRLAAVRGRLSLCADQAAAAKWRSEERRVGKECVSTWRYRGSPHH